MRAFPRVCLLAATLFAGCGGGNPAQPGPPRASPIAFASHSSAHFTFRYAPLDAAEFERQRYGL